MIKLNEKWRLEKDPKNWKLIETYGSKDKNGKPKNAERTRFYGTLYQGLQGFIRHSINSKNVGGIHLEVANAMESIDQACAKIEHEYKIVKVVRG